jgi:arsenate reductase
MFAEYLGTALLVMAIVGSGIMATRLSPGTVGLQLLENSIATMLALAALIVVFGPLSGAHFNPLVTLADWWMRRLDDNGPSLVDATRYVVAQLLGGISGAILANSMFGIAAVTVSHTVRAGSRLWLGEVVATAGLILLLVSLVRTRRTALAPAAVGAYIGAAYWFTSSTSFANPAVTVGRAFTDSFAGISPTSVPGFVAAQAIGALLGMLAAAALYPARPAVRAEGVVTGSVVPDAVGYGAAHRTHTREEAT